MVVVTGEEGHMYVCGEVCIAVLGLAAIGRYVVHGVVGRCSYLQGLALLRCTVQPGKASHV